MFQTANNEGAYQSARMRRLVCAFDVRYLQTPKTGFLASGPDKDKKFIKAFPDRSRLLLTGDPFLKNM